MLEVRVSRISGFDRRVFATRAGEATNQGIGRDPSSHRLGTSFDGDGARFRIGERPVAPMLTRILSVLPRLSLATVVLAVTAWVSYPANADMSAGWRALERGDMAAARKEWAPLAEQGDPGAQVSMGMLAELQHRYEDAARWYRGAAERGKTAAQVLLGGMYTEGRGVEQDLVEAYSWFAVAAAADHPNAVKARDAVAARMTTEQIARAQELAHGRQNR